MRLLLDARLHLTAAFAAWLWWAATRPEPTPEPDHKTLCRMCHRSPLP